MLILGAEDIERLAQLAVETRPNRIILAALAGKHENLNRWEGELRNKIRELDTLIELWPPSSFRYSSDLTY